MSKSYEKISSKKIVVTGGAGFIGSHIVDALVSLGAKVSVLDNLSTGRLENLTHIADKIEFIKGEIWANIWTTENLVIIDPATGKVTGEIDLSGISGSIMQNQKEQMDVLNGIAWNPISDKIYVTGKLWPKLFEIKLIKK